MWSFVRKRRNPWEGRARILDAVRAWDGRADLPDEEPARGRFRFSKGALDNVRARHFGLQADPPTARLFRALERAVTRKRAIDRATLYRLMLQHSAVDHAEALTERVAASALDRDAVAELARWLLAEAADRAPVKYALVLLAVCGSPADAELALTFARHDEFTMFAAAAIEHLAGDPLAAELAMAEQVRGWGKIALVERIAARGGDRADVRDWLLRRGCENAILDQYLAYVCATGGRLHEALEAETLDPELRAGACRIVAALIAPGPAEDMTSYEQGPAAVAQLLRHLAGTDVGDELEVVASLAIWLAEEQPGWPAEVRAHLGAQARAILTADGMEDRLRADLGSDDRDARFLAWQIAAGAGFDLWEDAFALLQREPLTDYLHQWLARTPDPMRLRRTLAFAEQNLPLDEIASGPADEMGFDDEFVAHSCLQFVLQELPGSGQFSARLVAAALRSPVVRNRYHAMRVLAATPRGEWGSTVTEVLARAAAEEPDEDLREELAALTT